MPTKTPNQQAYALISLYEKLYADKYGQKPSDLNRFKVKYAFGDMISDLGYGGSEEVIKYYFKTSRPGHPLQYLLYNYEKLERIRLEIIEDDQRREALRERTKLAVKEWDFKHGNQ